MKHFNKSAALSLLFVCSMSAGAVNVTFHVDHSDAVSMSLNGAASVLTEGDNKLDLKENDYLTFSGVSPWVITGVTDEAGTPADVYSGIWYRTIYASDEGKVYNIAVKNLDEARSASCTVNVDEPSLVNAVLSGTYASVSLDAGENTLKFDPENEKTLMLMSVDYQKPLYKVTLDGENVSSQGGSFYVDLKDGCRIDITARIPAEPATVTFSYSEDGAGAVAGVAVDGQDVADFDGTTLNVTTGQSLLIKPNYSYKITGLKINGESLSWSGEYDYMINSIMGDTEIYIEAHPYGTINVTLNVSDPGQIIIYRGYRYQNDVVELSGTSTQLELSENNTILSWSVANGCYVESVKVNGDAYTADNVTCTEGMVIDIETKAIVMDKTAAVWIDDRSLADQYFSFESQTREQLGGSFVSGYNIVDFYKAYNPFLLSWYTENPVVGKVYVNQELKAPMYEGSQSYELSLADRDVVKIFYEEEPVECAVSISAADGLDPKVTRDVICEVGDLSQPFACFAGTRIDIAKVSEAFDVKVNGEMIDPIEGSDDYSFTVTDPQTQVEIVDKVPEGLRTITSADTGCGPVYSLQGIKVSDTLDGLPAGIYISRGKKVVVK